MKLALGKMSREIFGVILKDLSAYGGFPFYGLVFLIALAISDFNFAYKLALSLVAVSVIVIAIRLAYFKPRPDRGRRKYGIFYERIDNSSFPSIHAARSVMISAAFFSKVALLLPIYILLILAVCASRTYFRRHDMADVAAGLLIGLVLGLAFF